MKVYLEFKDEKSEKFWEVSVDGNTHTVRYGKIGAKGTSKTKEFDSGEAAEADATKLANSKKKKGYVEIEIKVDDKVNKFASLSPTPKVMTYEKWEELDEEEHYFENDELDHVIFFEGDLHVKEDFDCIWCSELADYLHVEGDILIHVTGNLTVDGEISPAFDSNDMNLLVSGDVRCDILTSGDEIIDIYGDAYIKYVLVGDYNDGQIGIGGITYVPFVVNSDHSTCVNLEDETIVLCSFGSGDKMMDYHFVEDEFPEIMVDEVMPNGQFNLQRFIKVLKSGKSPLKEGIKIEMKHPM